MEEFKKQHECEEKANFHCKNKFYDDHKQVTALIGFLWWVLTLVANGARSNPRTHSRAHLKSITFEMKLQ